MAAKFKPCLVEGCNRNAHYTARGMRGWCRPHYARWLRNGDPTAGRTTPGALREWLIAHMGYGGDECLFWPFGRTTKGYGSLQDGKRTLLAHREMCAMAHGEPPEGAWALHRCGNGAGGCVNPKHLYWGTASDNQRDTVRHGRHTIAGKSGLDHPYAAFDTTSLEAVRTEIAKGVPDSAIARAFGVNSTTVRNVRLGVTYG